MYFYTPGMLIVMPAILIALYAQFKVKSTFSKYQDVYAQTDMTGADVANKLLESNGIYDVSVTRSEGKLSDHYDPKAKVVRLSPDVYGTNSLAALGVAAHEVGHAIQHAKNYAPLNIRHSLFPAANLGTQAGPILAVFGFMFGMQPLVTFGIIFFSAAVLFQIVTLPVELNASSRAMQMLRGHSFLTQNEAKQTRKVLNAAAFTYVAATLVSIAHLVRLVLLRRMLND